MPQNDDFVYGRQALKNGEPWIVPDSLTVLKNIVKANWRVFEWGGGGSTVFWSKHCQHVTTIEQNSEWITRLQDMFTKFKCKANIDLQYITITNGDSTNYANAILAYPDNHFDLVFVDGEASCRDLCVTNALSKVKPLGWLLVDNSNWITVEVPATWFRKDYLLTGLTWVGQPGTFDMQTSIFRRLE